MRRPVGYLNPNWASPVKVRDSLGWAKKSSCKNELKFNYQALSFPVFSGADPFYRLYYLPPPPTLEDADEATTTIGFDHPPTVIHNSTSCV